MDPDTYSFLEEFIFTDQGGVVGAYDFTRPHSGATPLLELDPAAPRATYRCGQCENEFGVDWSPGQPSTGLRSIPCLPIWQPVGLPIK